MVTATPGAITTVAGTGEPGCAGDGGPATLATLNEPKSVTIDGNFLYIADSENHRIRKVDLATGVITTVAGEGAGSAPAPTDTYVPPTEPSPELDPLADPVKTKDDKVVQLADQSGTVRFLVGTAEKGRFRGDGGPATSATLNFPSAVAVDSQGTLYIADTFNHRIRIVEAQTGIIRTLAGTGAARFSGDGGPADKAALNEPVALALDEPRGRLYIADLANYRVRMVELATGMISTVAGSGEQDYDGDGQPAKQAGLTGPSGLALDAEGNLYIADTFCGRIRRVDAATGLISTVAGDGGPAASCSLNYPFGVALDSRGNLYIADTFNHRIRMIAA